MQQPARLGIVVANRGAAGEAPLGADAAGSKQEGLCKQRLSRSGMAKQGNIAYVAGCLSHPFPRSSTLPAGFSKRIAL